MLDFDKYGDEDDLISQDSVGVVYDWSKQECGEDIYKEFFPYNDYRPKQFETIEKIDEAIVNKNNIMLRAPCGFGKSSSTITAALKNNKKVLLITPSHASRDGSANEVLEINNLRKKGYSVCDIRAKSDMCLEFHDRKSFSVELCLEKRKNEITEIGFKNCCDYFNNLHPGDAHGISDKADFLMEDLLDKQKNKGHIFKNKKGDCKLFDKCKELCEKKVICYYYLMMHQLKTFDVVIMDYFWVTTGLFRQLKENIGDLKEYVLLIDEADMFVERIGQGVNLNKKQINKLIQQIEDKQDKLKHKKEVVDDSLRLLCLLRDNFDNILNKFNEENAIDFDIFKNEIEQIFDIEEFVKKISEIVKIVKDDDETGSVSARPDKLFSLLLDLFENNATYGNVLYKATIEKKLVKNGRQDEISLDSEDDDFNECSIFLRPLLLRYALFNGDRIYNVFSNFNNVVLFSATLEKNIIQVHLGKEVVSDFYEVEYDDEDIKDLKVIVYTEVTSQTTKEKMKLMNGKYIYAPLIQRSLPRYKQLVKKMTMIKTGVLVGLTNTKYFSYYDLKDIKNLKIEREGRRPIYENDTCLVGLHQSESRAVNIAEKLSSAISAGYPIAPSDCYGVYANEQAKVFTELDREENTNYKQNYMHYKTIARIIQFIGRVTRNILYDPRLIILADTRFENNMYLLPDYLKKRVVVRQKLDDVLKEVQDFWNKKC